MFSISGAWPRGVTRAVRCFVVVCLLLTPAGLLALDVAEHTFDSDGVSIRYITMGKGDPLVLIHGFTASAETNWVLPGIAPRLAEEFEVIAIDNRGHGKSDKPHDPAEYGIKMVQDVINLLDHLGYDQAHIVGYSMGGFITMKLLSVAPERFLSATVGGAGWSRESDDSSMMEALASSLEGGDGVGPLIDALQPVGGPAPTAEEKQAANQMILAMNDPLALAAVIRGMADLTIAEEQVRAIEVPTLAIIGSMDPLKAGVDAMVGVHGDLEVHVLDGADHMSALMDPDHGKELVQALRDFVIAQCACA